MIFGEVCFFFISFLHFSKLLLSYQTENVEINCRMRDNEKCIFPSAILNLRVQEVSDTAGWERRKKCKRTLLESCI